MQRKQSKRQRMAGDLNNLFFKNKRGTLTQKKLTELDNEFKKFMSQYPKACHLLKFDKENLIKMQGTINDSEITPKKRVMTLKKNNKRVENIRFPWRQGNTRLRA